MRYDDGDELSSLGNNIIAFPVMLDLDFFVPSTQALLLPPPSMLLALPLMAVAAAAAAVGS